MRDHLVPETGCGLNRDMWFMRSFLDSETKREKERGGVEAIESKTGLCKVQRWPKIEPRDGQGFGAESGVKRRQIRRPFHSEVHLSIKTLNSYQNSSRDNQNNMRLQPRSLIQPSNASLVSALPLSLRYSLLRPYQSSSLRHSSQSSHSQVVRPLIPPPGEHSGPLLSRRPDRALPSVAKSRTWLKTLPIFVALITLSSLAIFNYQKSSSSTVNSILYALRTNETARS